MSPLLALDLIGETNRLPWMFDARRARSLAPRLQPAASYLGVSPSDALARDPPAFLHAANSGAAKGPRRAASSLGRSVASGATDNGLACSRHYGVRG
jgi:hypothetical protein